MAEYLPVAEILRPVAEIKIQDPLFEHHFAAGWYGAELGPPPKRWATGPVAAVDVPCIAKTAARIRLTASFPLRHKVLLPQDVEVHWNGKVLKTLPLQHEEQTFEIEIAARQWHLGINRLELWPLYWVAPHALGIGSDIRPLGAKFSKIEIVEDTPQVGPSSAAVTAEDDSIRQGPSTAIQFFFAMPAAASLRASVGVKGVPLPKQQLSGRATVTALGRDGTERVLFESAIADIQDDAPLSIDADLGELGGQMASLVFSFSQTESAEPNASPVQLNWTAPEIRGVAGKGGRRPRPHRSTHHNVLIVLFDALRADQIEPYGGVDVKTRTLGRLAAEGTTFVNALSTSSYTRSAVSSLLTGLDPLAHRTNHSTRVLPADVPYLPEILRAAGYETLMVYKNPQVSPQFGFGRGFDHVVDGIAFDENTPDQNAVKTRVDRLWTTLLGPLLRENREKPFFLYLHEIDPHAPYAPPGEFDLVDRLPSDGRRKDFAALGATNNMINQRGAFPLGPVGTEFLRTKYQGEIALMDSYLAAVFQRLRDAGFLDDTLVVFLADHGEEFMEHGGIAHSRTLYDEVLKIPMIWHLPGVIPPGRRPTGQVRITDVAPTILDLIGEPAPPQMNGVSLLPTLAAEDDDEERVLFAALEGRQLEAIRVGGWKLIRQRVADRDRFELFDLRADPGELNDLFAVDLIAGRTLSQSLRWYHVRNAPGAAEVPQVPVHLDDATRQRLRALGYMD